MITPMEETTDSLFPKVLSSILDVGQIMLTSGAEVNRVEDTIRRMATAYGCNRVDVFTITSSIVVTVHSQSGTIFTQTRRITEYMTNMYRLEQCNALSRRVCTTPLSLKELQQAIMKIAAQPPYSFWVRLSAYTLIAFSFSVFFGGNWSDGIAAGLCSIVLFFISLLCQRLRLQHIVVNILCSATVGLSALFLTRLGLGASVDKICIGNIMLLIPGIAFTTSLRDMINGDTISGLLGLCQALLQALAIAIGFAVLVLFGG